MEELKKASEIPLQEEDFVDNNKNDEDFVNNEDILSDG